MAVPVRRDTSQRLRRSAGLVREVARLPPSFFPYDTEAVWELAEHRSVFIVQQPEHAGHAMHTIIVDDLDTVVAEIAQLGLEPAKRETYSDGVRKITYIDRDGNEIGFGGLPR